MLRNAARAQSGWWVNSSSHGWKSVRMTLRNSRNRRKSKRKSLPDGGAANRVPGNLHVISAHLCRCRQRSQHHCRTPANKLPKTPQLKDPKPFTAPQRPISGRFCEKHTGKLHLLGSPDAFSKWLRHPPIVPALARPMAHSVCTDRRMAPSAYPLYVALMAAAGAMPATDLITPT